MSTSNGDTACDNITIIDDDVLEGEHSFEIQIVSTDPMLSTFNPASTVVTIQDNEGNVIVLLYGKKFRLTNNYCFLQMQQSCW